MSRRNRSSSDQRRWNLVLARLKAGEMPPSQSRQQPTPAQRQSVIDWIETVSAEDARRHPNDPGIVLARRLSNAEYDYTIHDLTGVDIRPAKEFPGGSRQPGGLRQLGGIAGDVAGARQKYLDAARRVADHILFLPSGFSFAPYPVVTDQDRDKYARQPDRRLLQAPAAGLRRLLPRRVAVSPPRRAAPAAG